MYCEKCGAELKPNAKFCSRCGSPVSLPPSAEKVKVNREEIPVSEIPKAQGNSETAPRKKKKPIALIVVLLLAVCAAAGAVIYLNSDTYQNKKSIKTDNASNEDGSYRETLESYDAVQEIDTDNEDSETSEGEDEVTGAEEPDDGETAVADETESSDEKIFVATEEEEPENERPVLNIDVEDEVKQIREWYYGTQNDIDGYEQSTSDNATFYLEGGVPVKIVVKKGTNGWNYAREYYYHDGEFYFAFIYDGGDEHRLYFKDDQMIRYIDQDKNTYDYRETDRFSDWETVALQEAYSYLESGRN